MLNNILYLIWPSWEPCIVCHFCITPQIRKWCIERSCNLPKVIQWIQEQDPAPKLALENSLAEKFNSTIPWRQDMHSAGRFTQNYPHSNFGQSKPGWPWQGYSLWPGDRISLQMKVTIPTKAQVLCPVLIFRNKPLSRSGRCRLGSIGRKRKKINILFH